MVMAAVLEIIARMGYAHVAEAKAAPKTAFDGGAVLRPHKIENGILRCWLSLSARCKRQASRSHGHCNELDELHDTRSFQVALRGKCEAKSMGRVSHVGVVTVSVRWPGISCIISPRTRSDDM